MGWGASCTQVSTVDPGNPRGSCSSEEVGSNLMQSSGFDVHRQDYGCAQGCRITRGCTLGPHKPRGVEWCHRGVGWLQYPTAFEPAVSSSLH